MWCALTALKHLIKSDQITLSLYSEHSKKCNFQCVCGCLRVWKAAQIDVDRMTESLSQKQFTASLNTRLGVKFIFLLVLGQKLHEDVKKQKHIPCSVAAKACVLCAYVCVCACVCGAATFMTQCVWLKSQCLVLLFAAFFIVAAEKPQRSLLPCKQTQRPQIVLSSAHFCQWRQIFFFYYFNLK